MDMYSKNQYLKELRSEYLKTKSKKEKGVLLDEAEKRTGLCRSDQKRNLNQFGSENILLNQNQFRLDNQIA